MSDVGNWFKDLGKDIGAFAVRDIWGNIITIFSCPFSRSDAWGTTLACFPSNASYTQRLKNALEFMAKDTRNDFTYTVVNGSSVTTFPFSPKSFSIPRIAYIIDGHAKEADWFTLGMHDEGQDAVTTYVTTGHSAPVIVWPSAYDHYITDSGLAGTLVHEADHTRFGAHTCASWGDTYEDGPYGTEIQYLAKIWRTGHPVLPMWTFDREEAWDLATSKLSQICDAGAQHRLWNTYLMDAPNPQNEVEAAALTSWQQAAPGPMTDVSVLPDGHIFALGTDGAVYSMYSAGGYWRLETTPYVTDLSVTPDGTIYGLGGDGAVYRSAGGSFGGSYLAGTFHYDVGTWTNVTTPWVSRISVTPDGMIYGIGGDNAVYRTLANGVWKYVADPWIKELSATPGYIYGISSDNAVYRTRANSFVWEGVTTPSVNTLSVTPNDFIYGVGDDHSVFVTRPGASWQWLASPWVSNISVTPGGMIYGVGSDQTINVHGSQQ